jgi:hypothetical protein
MAFGSAAREGESMDALAAHDRKALAEQGLTAKAPVRADAPPAPSRGRSELADGAQAGEFRATAVKKAEKTQDLVLADSTGKDKEDMKASDEARRQVAAEPLAAKPLAAKGVGAAPSGDRPRSVAPTGAAGAGGGIGGARGAAEGGKAEFVAKRDADAAREPRLVWRARDAQTAKEEIDRLAREFGGSVIWSVPVDGEPVLRATVPDDRAGEFEAMLAQGRGALGRQGASDKDRALRQRREEQAEREAGGQAPEPPAGAPGAAAEEAKVAATLPERGEALKEANAAEQPRPTTQSAVESAAAARTAQAATAAPVAPAAPAAAPAEAKQKQAEPQPQRVYVTFEIKVELDR